MIKSEVNIFDNDLDDNDGKFQILQAFRTRKNLNNEEDDQPMTSNILLNKLARELRVKFDDAQTQIFHAPTQDYSQNQSEIENEYQIGNYAYQKSKTNSPGKYQNSTNKAYIRQYQDLQNQILYHKIQEIHVQKDTPIEVTDELYEKKLNHEFPQRVKQANILAQGQNISLAVRKLKEIENKVIRQDKESKDGQKDCKIHVHKNLYSSENQSLNTKNIMRGKFTLKVNKRLTQQQLIEEFAQEPIIFHLHKNRKFMLKLEKAFDCAVKSKEELQQEKIEMLKIEFQKQKDKTELSIGKVLWLIMPQVIKTMFALREEDEKQKDEDIENVRLEHIQQKMNPNRYAAQLEKIQRTKNTKYKQ
eukprot:403341833